MHRASARATRLATAAFLASIVLANPASSISHTNHLYVVCKEPDSLVCIIWAVDLENVAFTTKELYNVNGKQCGLSDLKPIPPHRRFIAVRLFDEEITTNIYCRTVNLKVAAAPIDFYDANVNRVRRQTGYQPRGRYRGQTQSQYLSIDRGNGKDEGKAEAHSAADSSRAIVSGNSGMGQAQSQTVYDPSCDDCLGRNDLDVENLSYKPSDHGHIGSNVPGGSNSQSKLPEDSYGPRIALGGMYAPGKHSGGSHGLGPTPGGTSEVGQSPRGSYRPGQLPGGSYGSGQGSYPPDKLPGGTGISSGGSYEPGQLTEGSYVPGKSPGGAYIPGQASGRSYRPGQLPGGSYVPGQESYIPGKLPGGSGQPQGGSHGPGKSNEGSYRPGQLPGATQGTGQVPGGSYQLGQLPRGSNGPGQGSYTPGNLPGGSEQPQAGSYRPGQSTRGSIGPGQGSYTPGNLPGGSEQPQAGLYRPGQSTEGFYGPGQSPGESYGSGQSPGTHGSGQIPGASYQPGQLLGGSYGLGQSPSGSPGQSPGSSYEPDQLHGGSQTPGQSPTGSYGPRQSPGGSAYLPGQTQGGSYGPGQSPGGLYASGLSPGGSLTPSLLPGGSNTPGSFTGNSYGPGQPQGSFMPGQSLGGPYVPGRTGYNQNQQSVIGNQPGVRNPGAIASQIPGVSTGNENQPDGSRGVFQPINANQNIPQNAMNGRPGSSSPGGNFNNAPGGSSQTSTQQTNGLPAFTGQGPGINWPFLSGLLPNGGAGSTYFCCVVSPGNTPQGALGPNRNLGLGLYNSGITGQNQPGTNNQIVPFNTGQASLPSLGDQFGQNPAMYGGHQDTANSNIPYGTGIQANGGQNNVRAPNVPYGVRNTEQNNIPSPTGLFGTRNVGSNMPYGSGSSGPNNILGPVGTSGTSNAGYGTGLNTIPNPNGPAGTAGQNLPYAPGNQGQNALGPGRTGPNVGYGTGSLGQKMPGSTGQDAGAGAGLGSTGKNTAYIPGSTDQNSAYLPGGTGQNGAYGPVITGQNGVYSPGSTGQQSAYAPGSTGQQPTYASRNNGLQPGYTPGSVQQTGYAPGSTGQQPGYTPGSNAQLPGYPPGSHGLLPGYPSESNGQQPGYTTLSNGQPPGYAPGRNGQQPAYTPGTNGQQSGYAPGSTAQQPGYAPASNGQQPGYVPGSNGQSPGYAPGSNGQQSGYAPGSNGENSNIVPNVYGTRTPDHDTPNEQYGAGTGGQNLGSNTLQSPNGPYGTANGGSGPGQNALQLPDGQFGPSNVGQYGTGQNNLINTDGPYGTQGGGQHYNQPGTIDQRIGTQGGDQQNFGQNNGNGGTPLNVIDANSITSTLDDYDSEAQASVAQSLNGTTAVAASKGGNQKGRAQTQVEGTYTGTGSFSANAEISEYSKAAQSSVSGSNKGASSSAEGRGRKNKSQASVKLGSETGSILTESQSGGDLHSSSSQVQGSVKGGMADAQAKGPGSTSSQAQIGFTPYKEEDKEEHDKLKTPFEGGGTASAQTSGRRGTSQSQLRGTFKYGITYNGAAQAGSSLDKDAVFSNLQPFEKIDVFDENNKNINIGPLTTEQRSDLTKTRTEPNSSTVTTEANHFADIQLTNHSHLDHHTTSQQNSTTRPPPEGNRRSFPPNYSTNGADYEYSTDKEDNQQEDYDIDDGFGSDGTENGQEQNEYTNYDDLNRDTENTQQPLQSPNKNGLEVRQSTGGNTQHIVLGSLKNHDAKVIQKNSDHPDESKIYQPGERVPGMGGYTIPAGFTGSVKSVASKDKTYVVGSKSSPSQAQTVTLTPGTGKVRYGYPNNYGKNINRNDLKSLYNSKPDDNRYVSVSKSVTRDLDNENNIRRQYSHTYYTKSSSCGYFTFTCTTVSSAEGKKKVCKPKIPTNPDGSPMRC